MSYYNTTNESGTSLLSSESDAANQEESIINLYRRIGMASPSQVSVVFPKWPLTSIRRAITDLTKVGYLVKTDTKQIGLYGKPESVWRLP